MKGPGRGLSILFAAAALLAPPVRGAEGTSGEYWVIVIPPNVPGDSRHEDYYEMAVYRMPGEPGVSQVAMLSSRCVSHTLVGQFRHAQRYCDEAMQETREATSVRSGLATQLALAYSNRGVLRARAGDPAGAEHDFGLALELRSETGVPARNLARLKARRASGLTARD
jgi:hypothetical protein